MLCARDGVAAARIAQAAMNEVAKRFIVANDMPC